jgi:hypothetical protein
MISRVLLAALLFSSTSVQAQEDMPKKIVDAEVYGAETCPKAAEDEIVVCRRLPEDERFRLPKRFRESRPDAAKQAWTNRAEVIDEVGRVAGGLPNTCSVIGTGGQTGCTQDMIRQWVAARRAQQAEAAAATRR